ncbi:MAG: hypothetical protein Q8K70_03115 [Bacteroidota bacterium]|nr:hypothetical protein [Bacteroidota bacterium]
MNRNIQFISVILFVIILTTALKNTEKQVYTLQEALSKKLVEVQIQNNPKSSHYGKPIQFIISNLKNYAIEIKTEKGTLIDPETPSYQTIIISKDEQMPLAANEKNHTKSFYGFCTESHDGAPGSKTINYQLGKKANPKMLSLIDFISKEKLHSSYEGQNAVWVLANNSPLENITGFDTLNTRKIQKFLSKLTGKPMPPPPSKDDYKRNYYASEYKPKMQIKGNFTLQSPRPSKVRIGMFDTANICVRELYLNNELPKGTQNIGYDFDASQYENRFYYIKTIVDDKIIFHSRYDLKTGKIWKVQSKN